MPQYRQLRPKRPPPVEYEKGGTPCTVSSEIKLVPLPVWFFEGVDLPNDDPYAEAA